MLSLETGVTVSIAGSKLLFRNSANKVLGEIYAITDEGNSLLESFRYDSEGNITSHMETGAVTGDYKKFQRYGMLIMN
jgi:hypothetical protein